MAWSSGLVQRLAAGETVQFRPHGNSMTPRIKSGALVTIEPIIDHDTIKKGDVVFAKVGKNLYLHLVSAVKDGRFQISNNHGHVNGWTTREKVYGKLIAVAP